MKSLLKSEARRLRRRLQFAVLIIGSLTTVFLACLTLASQADPIFRPVLPYANSDKLIQIVRRSKAGAGQELQSLAKASFLQRSQLSLNGIVAVSGTPSEVVITTGDLSIAVNARMVTQQYFDIFQTTPLAGRTFLPEDVTGPVPSIVLTRSVAERLGGAHAVVGAVMSIGAQPHRVVGIAPDSFVPVQDADAWIAVPTTPRDQTNRFFLYARLSSNGSLRQFNDQMRLLKPEMDQEFPRARQEAGDYAASLAIQLTSPFRRVGLLLAGAGLLIILGMLASSVSIVLGYVEDRVLESGIREALGHRPGEMVQTVTAVAGLLLIPALALALTIYAYLPETLLGLPRTIYSTSAVVQTSAVLVLSASMLFILLSAAATYIRSLTLRPLEMLRSRPGVSKTSIRLHLGLAFAQTLITLILLGASGLIGYHVMRMTRQDLGVKPDGLSSFHVSFAGSISPETPLGSALSLVREAQSRVEQLWGDGSRVAVTSSLPLEQGFNLPVSVVNDDRVTDPVGVEWRYVSAGYLNILGIRLLEGRDMDDRDASTASPVAIVNAEFRRRFLAGDAVGRHVQLLRGAGELEDPVREVVGVCSDVLDEGPLKPAVPIIYVPYQQVSPRLIALVEKHFSSAWIVKPGHRQGSPSADAVADALKRVHPTMALSRYQKYADVIDSHSSSVMGYFRLVLLLGVLSLSLSTLSLHAFISYYQARSARSVAIRQALGATPGQIVRSILGRTITSVCLAAVLVSCFASLLTRAVGSVVVGITADYAWVVIVSIGIAVLLPLGAGYLSLYRDVSRGSLTHLREC